MSLPEPAGSGETCHVVPGELWVLFDAALESAVAEWRAVIEDAPSQEEAGALLGQLKAAVVSAAAYQPDPAGGVPHSLLARRLLELLRRETIRQLAGSVPAPPGEGVVGLLCAIERVNRDLEPDWAQHFSDRLSGPDGLELVVEVAHDLRSPLTSILFLAETLQRGRSGPVTPVQERQLGLIYSAAFGLSSLASDVIELARGGDRLVDLDPLPFSVTDILESVRDIVQPIAEEKGLRVEVDAPRRDFRLGHPVAISRVLLNLTTNALKFTSEGQVEIAAAERPGNRIEFSVRDTGRGVSPHAMLTLFEPFRRREKQGEYAFSGAGLGLSICRKLVEAMQSTLEVETARDLGTRFHFELHLPPAPYQS